MDRRPHGLARDDGYVPGDRAVGQLLETDVGEPGVEHAHTVVEEAGGGCEDLDVTGPAEAFVALGAVGGNVDEVAAHAPYDVLVQAVDQRFAALEPAGSPHVRVVDPGGHHVGGQVRRPAADFGVAEAVEGEAWFPGERGPAGEDQGVGGVGLAQRPCGEFALLQDLGVPEGDGGVGRAVEGDAEAADEVLAEVEQVAVAAGAGHLDRCDLLGAAHGWARGGDEGAEVTAVGAYGRPFPRTQAGGGGPAGVVQPCVERLALVQAAGQDRSGGGAPGAVRGDRDRGSVLVRHLQLGEEGLVGAVDVAGAAVEAVLAAVPAVTEPGADGVGAFGEVAGDVVGAVAQAVRVDRPAWGEGLVADPAPVDLRLVQAVRRDVEAGARDGPVETEVLADTRRPAVGRRVLVPGRADRDRVPVGRVEQARLGHARRAPLRGSVRVRRPDADADGHAFAGGQRGAGPGDEHLVPAVEAAGAVGPSGAGEFELVCLLGPAAFRQRPRQSGGGHADAETVREMFEGHRGGLRGEQGKPFVTCTGAGRAGFRAWLSP